MSLFTLWLLITVIPNLSVLCELVCFFTVVIFLFCLPVLTEQPTNRGINIFVIVFVISVLGACILPDASQMKLIISSHYATNIDGIKELPENMVKYLNDYLSMKD